jgi:hypothetical protein
LDAAWSAVSLEIRDTLLSLELLQGRDELSWALVQASSTAAAFKEFADPSPKSLGAAGGPVARKLENAGTALQRTAYQRLNGAIVRQQDTVMQKRSFSAPQYEALGQGHEMQRRTFLNISFLTGATINVDRLSSLTSANAAGVKSVRVHMLKSAGDMCMGGDG